MSLPLQAKLLRVLQEREVERLGGQGPIALDVRVLATTNRDLKREVAAGRFREDLYYRVNVFPLRLPPLRARPGDIGPLAEYLLARFAGATGQRLPQLDGPARARLLDHPWPGNVRELGNVLQRALILARGGVIRESDLAFESSSLTVPAELASLLAESSDGEAPDGAVGLEDELRQRERERILSVLAQEGGNRALAAARLGISPRTLRHKLQRMREAGAGA
jgi:two-component system response regulator FlrC